VVKITTQGREVEVGSEEANQILNGRYDHIVVDSSQEREAELFRQIKNEDALFLEGLKEGPQKRFSF
jgi:hypothetical protein